MLDPADLGDGDDDRLGGPTTSDASLRAALDTERLHAAHLQQLTDQQGKLLRRPPVRVALALDRRAQAAVERMRRGVSASRQGVARARLTSSALLVRRDLAERRAALAALCDALPPPPVDPRRVAVVVVVDEPGPLLDHRFDPTVHVVLVLTGKGIEPPPGFDGTVMRAGHKTAAAATRDGVRASRGELVCIVRATSEPLEPGWLARLTSAVAGDVVAAAPMLVHPLRPPGAATRDDLRIRALGLDVVPTPGAAAPEVRAHRAGDDPLTATALVTVAAGSSAGLAFRREAFQEAGGLSPTQDLDAALVDLCTRMRAGGGQVVAVPASVLVDHRPVPSVRSLRHPLSSSPPTWRRLVGQPTVAPDRPVSAPLAAHLLVRLTVAAPTRRDAPRWGDWHLAEGLARGLRRQGHSVHVATLADRGATPGRSVDVHVVLRGRTRVPRRDERSQVLWIISHPETVRTEECDDADLVLAASERFAAELRARTSTPVEVLLQGTDGNRFTPRPPDPRFGHAVAVVAASRNVFRPSVRDALAVGLRPAIYGPDWKDFVDPDLVVATYVPNDQLPILYSSVGVLLNDHWDLMRSWGFVSNRLFDAVACETPVISDHLPEIAEIFGDSVVTYQEPDELRAAADAALEDPTAARLRTQEGRAEVLAHHTLDHRARRLVELIEKYDLAPRT